MNESIKFSGSLAVTDVVAAAGSAFTATGLTDNASPTQFIGGSVSQCVTGTTPTGNAPTSATSPIRARKAHQLTPKLTMPAHSITSATAGPPATKQAPAVAPERGSHLTGPSQASEASDAGLLRAAVFYSWDPIIAMTVDGVITSWNPAAQRVFGYTTSEILGKPCSLLSPKDRLDQTRADLATLRTGRPVENLETSGLRKDGTVFPAWVAAAPILDQHGAVVAVTATHRDLTAMKQALEAAQRMRSIVEHSDQGIFEQTLDGIITTWNPAAQRMYGYTEHEIVGQSIDLLIGVDGFNETRSIQGRIRAGEPLEHLETIQVRKDGTLFPVSLTISPLYDQDGSLVGVSSIARDMGERRKATGNARSVPTQEKLLNTVIRSASIGIILAGTDGRIQVVNRWMCDFLGYDEAWFLAHELRDLVHPDEVENGARDRARLIEGSKDPLTTKMRLVRSDGATIWVSRAMVVIPGQDGKPDLLLVQARDITAEHQSARVSG